MAECGRAAAANEVEEEQTGKNVEPEDDEARCAGASWPFAGVPNQVAAVRSLHLTIRERKRIK